QTEDVALGVREAGHVPFRTVRVPREDRGTPVGGDPAEEDLASTFELFQPFGSVAAEHELPFAVGGRKEVPGPGGRSLQRREDSTLPGDVGGTAGVPAVVRHEHRVRSGESSPPPAGQETELGQHLESVADAGEKAARLEELLEVGADGGADTGGEDRPRADVIAAREPAGHEQGRILRESPPFLGHDFAPLELLQLDYFGTSPQICEGDAELVVAVRSLDRQQRDAQVTTTHVRAPGPQV